MVGIAGRPGNPVSAGCVRHGGDVCDPTGPSHLALRHDLDDDPGKRLTGLLVGHNPRQWPRRLQDMSEPGSERLHVALAHPVGHRPACRNEEFVIGEVGMAKTELREDVFGHDAFDPESAIVVGCPGFRPVFGAEFVVLASAAAVDRVGFKDVAG